MSKLFSHINCHGPLYFFQLSIKGREFISLRKSGRQRYIADLTQEHFTEDDEFHLYDSKWSYLSDGDMLEIILGRMIYYQNHSDVEERLRKALLVVQHFAGDKGAPTKKSDEFILEKMIRCWVEDLVWNTSDRRKTEGLARHCIGTKVADPEEMKATFRRLARKFTAKQQALFEKVYLPDPARGAKVEENLRTALFSLARIGLVDRRFLNPTDEELETLIDFGAGYQEEMSSVKNR